MRDIWLEDDDSQDADHVDFSSGRRLKHIVEIYTQGRRVGAFVCNGCHVIPQLKASKALTESCSYQKDRERQLLRSRAGTVSDAE